MSGPTLPGDIEGLLRRGSPVLDGRGAPGVVFRVDPEGFSVQADDADAEWDGWHGHALRLDLSDPTGRAHAAWWIGAEYDAGRLVGGAEATGIDGDAFAVAMAFAMGGAPMSDEQVDILRRVVLHVAGRTT